MFPILSLFEGYWFISNINMKGSMSTPIVYSTYKFFKEVFFTVRKKDHRTDLEIQQSLASLNVIIFSEGSNSFLTFYNWQNSTIERNFQ